jgi:hypothetical protein
MLLAWFAKTQHGGETNSKGTAHRPKSERTQRGTVLGAIEHGSLQKERLDFAILGESRRSEAHFCTEIVCQSDDCSVNKNRRKKSPQELKPIEQQALYVGAEAPTP